MKSQLQLSLAITQHKELDNIEKNLRSIINPDVEQINLAEVTVWQ
jgi:hypothetical protein